MSAESAVRLSPDDVREAAARVEGHVRRTPVLSLEADALGLGVPVWCKLESQQVTGTFKTRNAFSLLLGADVPDAGVVAASGGNFGLAVAHAARCLGHPATIFVPESTPQVKVDGIRAHRATVELVPGPAAEAFAASAHRVEETGALFAHPYDQVRVVAGAGTCGLELDEQVPGLDTVLVAVGGGGLIGGIATWFDGRARVVAVETEGTATLHESRRAGERVELAATGLAASSLGAPRVGELGWSVAERLVSDALVVTDEDVAAAQRRLWEAARLVAEPGGATALAALLTRAYVPDEDERVAVVLCGGNTPPGSVPAS